MPLKDKLTAEEFTALKAEDQPLYVKTAGADGAPDTYALHPLFIAERTALSANSTQLKTEKQKAADALKLYEDLGLTPEQITEIKTAKEAADAAKLTDAEKKTRAEQALKTAHQAELDRVKNEAKAREDFLSGQLRKNMIEATAKAAIAKAGIIDGGEDVLLPHVIASMEMLEEGDGDARSIVTRIVGPDKQPRYTGSNFMTADELVGEYKTKPGFMGVFQATGAGGGGAQQQGKTGAAAAGVSIKRAAFDALSPDAKLAHVKGGGTVAD